MADNIRLSQCMIVKNEEKNIRRALSWGKDVVWEQIVVDTGSTDNTVKIAESMGAKVFHFQWCDDFAAAKNYAIERARGEWIAFLDADEYFRPEDAHKLSQILWKANKLKKNKNKNVDIIRAMLIHLENETKVSGRGMQDRIFRNSKDIRYMNSIHEVLHSTMGRSLNLLDAANELFIMHTGYSSSAMRDGGKAKRNIKLLREQIRKNPQNYEAQIYLADSLLADGQHDEAKYVVESAMPHIHFIKSQSRYCKAYFVWFYVLAHMKAEEAKPLKEKAYEYYDKFCEREDGFPDVDCQMGYYLKNIGDNSEAAVFLERALEKAKSYKGGVISGVAGDIEKIYFYLLRHYYEEKNAAKSVYYGTMFLHTNPFTESVLTVLLKCLQEDENTTAEHSFSFVSKLYDFEQMKSKLFVLKVCKEIEYFELEEYIRNTMKEEELLWLDTPQEKSWILTLEELRLAYPQISISNRNDQNFLYIIGEIEQKSEKELADGIKDTELAHELKRHREDLLSLYEKLGDYRSRQCLYGILESWLHQETKVLSISKENGLQFWDMDLIPTTEGMTCINIGEYTLESVKGFLYVYEEMYKKIFCFVNKTDDMTEEEMSVAKSMEESLCNFRDVSLLQVELENLCLDSKIEEKIDLIKVDVKTGIIPLIEGAAEHIRVDNPKLAICLDGSCDNLWQVPKVLKELNPDYRFYLRYYGEGTVPERYVLFAI